ncbi:conjugal transfer pilin signal peptidase TrbI [Rahnella inusitata]|nr:conjugal transfer pilin signal peptidase TrbI [Rahnella inusitata]
MTSEQKKPLHILLIIFSLTIGSFITSHILIPATHSVFPRLLWKTGTTTTTQNEYVLFEHLDKYLPEGETHLVKRLGCVEGQYLSRLNLQFYCDGNEIAIAHMQDSTGKSLPIFNFTGVVPPGKAFAVGDTDNSYDSRYWGFIELSKAQRLRVIF